MKIRKVDITLILLTLITFALMIYTIIYPLK